jgi:hypothetical protein
MYVNLASWAIFKGGIGGFMALLCHKFLELALRLGRIDLPRVIYIHLPYGCMEMVQGIQHSMFKPLFPPTFQLVYFSEEGFKIEKRIKTSLVIYVNLVS